MPHSQMVRLGPFLQVPAACPAACGVSEVSKPTARMRAAAGPHRDADPNSHWLVKKDATYII